MHSSHRSPERAIAFEYGRWVWRDGEIRQIFVVTVLLNIFLGFTDKFLKAESAEKKKDR